MAFIKEELVVLARQLATEAGLDPVLVCAVVEQESSWNVNAIRFEPAFYTRYVQSQVGLSRTEGINRAQSWGLMQVMGQVAREFHWSGTYFTELCSDPEQAIRLGCKVLKSKLATHPELVEAGLLRYNGGSDPDYGKKVLARMKNYA